MTRITVELGQAPLAMVQRVQTAIFFALVPQFPGLQFSITADREVPPDPFAIPAFDFSTNREVDDEQGRTVDPYAELKAGIRESIGKLVATLAESDVPLEGDCGNPDCGICRPNAGTFSVDWPYRPEAVPTRADNKAGTIDANGNAVSDQPGLAYSSGTIVILADEIEFALAKGWAKDGPIWSAPTGQILVKVRR